MNTFSSSDCTVLIATSPSPLHPDTAIIDHTISSIRHHLPHSPIIVLADGVRSEFAHHRDNYSRYLLNLRNEYNSDIEVLEFAVHTHQAGMVAFGVTVASTPLVLVCEHDLSFLTTPDRPIDWQAMADCLLSGTVDSLRFMLKESIHPEHEYLMHGRSRPFNTPLAFTTQASGWNHLASTDRYREWMRDITPTVNCTLESWLQTVVERDGWDRCRLAVYLPSETMAARLQHLDARRGDPQYLDQQVYR